MIVIEKNAGPKIPYEEVGSRVIFDDDLSINLARREQDWAVHTDICYNSDGELVIGAAAGRAYVAEIDIPARRYIETEETIDDEQVVTREPIPLDMDAVTLTLWAIE